MYGDVGTLDNGDIELEHGGTLRAAVKLFLYEFKGCSGHSWTDRKSQPKKGQHMLLEQNYKGMWSKWWPKENYLGTCGFSRSIYLQEEN